MEIIEEQTIKRLSRIWYGMIRRCENPKDKSFKDYGGRGITTCKEWHSKEAFICWALNNGYSNSLSIDRKDNNKGYHPDNCRWATNAEQANNKRTCHYVKAFGKVLTTTQWSELVGMDRKTLILRLQSGMTAEEALTTPLMKNGLVYKTLKPINNVDIEIRRFNDYVRGELKRRHIGQQTLADYLGVSRSTLSYRLSGQIEWSYRDYLKVCEYFGKESKWDDMQTS